MLRAAARTQSAIMNTGKLVKDDIVIDIVKQRTKKYDCCNGFILYGFPSTIIQAKKMKDAGKKK